MGSPEIVILIVLGLIILLPLLLKAASQHQVRGSRQPSRPIASPTAEQIPQPTDLPGVRAAIARGDWRHAVDLYHEASGLPRDRAESAVMAVIEPGPNQTGADQPPPSGDRAEDQWPGLPDRNRSTDDD